MTDRPATEFDLASYRSEELVSHLVDVVSVPGAIRKVLSTAVAVVLLGAVACGLLRSATEFAMLPWLAASFYTLLICVVLGIALGLLRVVRAAMAGVQGVLETSLHITARAASDYQQLGTGQLKLPSGQQLFAQVHEQVLEPSLERAVSRSFGVLATPLLWLYRRSIGTAVGWVIRHAQVERHHEYIEDLTQSTLGTLAGYAEATAAFTTAASGQVERVGDRLRFYAMLPMWMFLVVASAIAVLPLALFIYLLG